MKDLKIPNSVRENKEKESVRYLLEVITSKGVLKQEDFYLSVAEFIEVMSVFTSETKTCIRGQEEYNTILIPLDSALKKARLYEDNIDYVLLIGGSAQNPFIQEVIKEKFADSKILIPQDLQTHVSQGTAIHSILVNALGKCIIQPITSEPILVITKDMLLLPKIVMPAGTSIPSDTYEVNDLVTSRDGQTEIELPICVGNKNKILFNLKIYLQKAVPINTPVQLVMRITADKLLYATANCEGVECTIEPQNPFANKELSTEERIVLRAERQANLEALQNDGVPTKNALINLRNAYEEVGNDFRAAETMEYLEQLYPSAANYNKIGVLYSNAGNKSKALKFYELAYENSPENGIINFNLGHSLLEIDSDRARRLLKRSNEINPEHAPTLITLARLEKESENIDKSNEYRLKAYDILIKKWKTDTLKSSDYSWLVSVASELGYKDIAYQVRESQEKLKQDEYYNDENLTTTKINSIQKL
jgi:tetratricopeptide (TPR) repeat protein